MDQSIHVLHVEDEPGFADLVSTFLHREDNRIDVWTATTPAEGQDILAEHDIDCIVSDYDMPGQNGLEFLEAVRETHSELPFILYTGKGSEEVASEAISAGVTDYLQKASGTSQYTVLANRIINAVEKYRTQTELADREHRLDLFFEQSPLGVIRWDQTFNIARVNDTAEDILGYDEDELVGQSWDVLVPEDERGEIGEDVVAALLDDQGGYHSINENVRKNGNRIVCEWHNWVVTDDNDAIVAIFSQFQDITEQKEQQQELERYRAITQAANSTIITIDEGNTIQSVNPAVEDTFGYEPAEIVGEDLTVLMAEEMADQHRAAFERYVETGEKTLDWNYVEVPGQHQNGSPIPLSLSFGEITFEGDRMFVGVVRDISEQKEQQQELKRARSRFQTIFEASNDAMFVLDLDNETIVDANSQAEQLLGYSRDELLSSVALSDIHPNDMKQYREFLDLVRTEELGKRGDFQCVTKAGESKECEISASVTELDDDQYVIAIVRDISDRKQHEQRLEQFASSLSHDLRNPLNVAEGQLELAREECDSEYLERIERAHERMRTLIDDVLTLARGGEKASGLEPVDLAWLVETCWQNVTTAGATLSTDVERTIRADRSQLKQLVENLIRNAVEHGGEDVTITVRGLDDGFCIEDDGPGIPKDERDEVFDARYSTNDEGTGFGLSIVKQVVDAHDWEIHITEGTDGGARFEITGVAFAAE